MGVKPALLRSAYQRALAEAHAVGARTIAFPSISTGVYAYPVERATPVAVAAVIEWLDAWRPAGGLGGAAAAAAAADAVAVDDSAASAAPEVASAAAVAASRASRHRRRAPHAPAAAQGGRDADAL
jgi:hypothetical protein